MDKARKVFRHGVSTTAQGEKEKSLAVLSGLCQRHSLVLFDLDPQLPRRLDLPLLRVKIGLAPVGTSGQAAQPTGAEQRAREQESRRQWDEKAARERQRKDDEARAQAAQQREREEQARKRREEHARQKAEYQRQQEQKAATASADPEVLLFRHLGAAERKRWLHGPMFSQGLLHAIRNTSAYRRLLAEVHSLDVSNVGVGLGDKELMSWLDKALSRQGSRVKCKHGSETIFDDVLAYCRFEYMSATEERRQAAQRRKAQEEQRRAEEARRQKAEADRERERTAAEQLRREQEARWDRDRRAAQEQRAATATGASRAEAGTTEYTRAFEDRAQARLYFKVARRQVGTQGDVKGTEANGRFTVSLVVTAALKEGVDRAFRQALYDLQLAAAAIRTEAARARDEAVRQAEAAYTRQCERAFQVAVEQYRA